MVREKVIAAEGERGVEGGGLARGLDWLGDVGEALRAVEAPSTMEER